LTKYPRGKLVQNSHSEVESDYGRADRQTGS